MIDHEECINQLDIINMTMEILHKAVAHFDKIEYPMGKTYFKVKANIYNLYYSLCTYEETVEHVAEVTEEDVNGENNE